MPYVDIEGKKVYYHGSTSREGIPLLFCHGSGGGHHHWHYQHKEAPRAVNPLALDLPGHGRSEGKAPDSIALYRDWLERFIKALKLESFILAGHSLGGAIALAFALEYPAYIRGLILFGTGARLRVLPAFLEELKQDCVPEAMIDYLYAPGTSKKLVALGRREMKNNDPRVFLADLTACDNFDITEKLPLVKAPSLIICGSEDSLTPLKYSRFLEQNIPQSRLEIIEGAGHMVMLEKPEAVNRAIAKFIEEDLS